jgi:hypothetical protein
MSLGVHPVGGLVPHSHALESNSVFLKVHYLLALPIYLSIVCHAIELTSSAQNGYRLKLLGCPITFYRCDDRVFITLDGADSVIFRSFGL